MPLNKPGLKADLQALSESPGSTITACASAWADALESYASGLIPPSTTVAAARATLEIALAAAFALPAAAPAMDIAFTAFATTLAGGQLPLVTGTPPSSPVGFATLFLPPYAATAAIAATALSDAIHAWMTTGSGALVAPPNTVTPWS